MLLYVEQLALLVAAKASAATALHFVSESTAQLLLVLTASLTLDSVRAAQASSLVRGQYLVRAADLVDLA